MSWAPKTEYNMKVMKAGAFTDGNGNRLNWLPMHLEQMVRNFNHLVVERRAIHVPWRINHGRDAGAIVGYVRDLRTDGVFLYADVEFTEEEAWVKYRNGTLKARSSEISAHQTNDLTPYWPVLMGVAFVDNGAVEGLF